MELQEWYVSQCSLQIYCKTKLAARLDELFSSCSDWNLAIAIHICEIGATIFCA